MGIKGDFGKLKAWSKKLERAGSAGFRRRLLANIGEELVELIREGFEKESDPSGARWAPLKAREGRILQDTGRLRSSFHRTSLSGRSVIVGSGVVYSAYHQSGTRRGLPARKMVPDGGTLPSKWASRIRAIAQDVLAKQFR